MRQARIQESNHGYDLISPGDEILSSREPIVFIDNEITRTSAMEYITTLMMLDDIPSVDKIRIYINSPGGSVSDGLALFDTIRSLKKPVETIAIGMCASIAVIIYLSTKERYVHEHTQFLIHNPLAVMHGAAINALDLDDEAKRILAVRDTLADIIFQETKLSREEVLELMKKESYIDSETAIKLGVAKKLIRKE